MENKWMFKNNNKDREVLYKMMEDFEVTKDGSQFLYSVESIHDREYSNHASSYYDKIRAEIYEDRHIEYIVEESEGRIYNDNYINMERLDELRKFCELFVRFADGFSK